MRILAASIAMLFAAPPLLAAASDKIINAAPIKCAAGTAVNERGFVRLGGIEQFVTIKGSDCRNPVILVVHGGPGNPNTPFANSPYAAWEKEFTLVQWDQRGAGKTFTRNPVSEDTPLALETIAQDGTELAAFVQRHLNKKKVILFGGSWGSAVSVHMAKARPELFGAYVGTGQLVKSPDNDIAGYNALLAMAREAGDAKTVTTLEALGDPPWRNPRSFGIMRRASRVYEAKGAAPAPKEWWELLPEHATEQAREEYTRGEDYSFLQFVGMKGDGMQSRLDLPKLGYDFKMPVYLIQGEQDLVTVPSVAKAYFDAIKAPRKEFISLPGVGHDPNPAMVAAQYKVLTTHVAPLMK